MQWYANVVPCDAHFAAYLIFLPLFQEDRSQDSPVAFRQFFEDLAHHPTRVFRNHAGQSVRFARNEAFRGLVLQRFSSVVGAEVLREHVVADGIDQWTKALSIPNAALAPQ